MKRFLAEWGTTIVMLAWLGWVLANYGLATFFIAAGTSFYVSLLALWEVARKFPPRGRNQGASRMTDPDHIMPPIHNPGPLEAEEGE